MDRSAGVLEEAPQGAAGPSKRDEGIWYPKWYWPSFSLPAIVWLFGLFLLPFYVTLAVAMGTVDIFQNPVPVWAPWNWSLDTFQEVIGKIFGVFGEDALFAPAFIRTILYVIIASVTCIIISYPVAYYVARFGGKRRTLLLVLLIAPFWVSYLMRMLAWTSLLAPDGWVNGFLGLFGIAPVGWLEGMHITVIFGLIYGYIPYMILPLYAGLDRINQNLLEASRDLGANPVKTFFKVTLPLSKQAILAGAVIITLPMFGDYYTTYLLSQRSNTTMIGSLIEDKLGLPGESAEAAALVMILMVLLIPIMLYYLRSTKSEA